MLKIMSKNFFKFYSEKNLFIETYTSDLRKLPFPSYLGKYFIKIGKITAKIHEIGGKKRPFLDLE